MVLDGQEGSIVIPLEVKRGRVRKILANYDGDAVWISCSFCVMRASTVASAPFGHSIHSTHFSTLTRGGGRFDN